MIPYRDVHLFINGEWVETAETLPILNPATSEIIGRVARANAGELAQALEAAAKGFAVWRGVSAFERCKILRRAADLLRDRVLTIATLMTLEQGKPLAEAKGETLGAADTLDWLAEEGKRSYGRVIPARSPGVTQLVLREPVGPVAAFTPWNFPLNQAVRKLGAALATGCSIILKGPEETPASCAALIQALADAGVPAGAINLVYGIPSEISETLIPHPVIAKVTFTGSTPVGKQLAALAGRHMKRITMELGGHAPVVIAADADIPTATRLLAGAKTRNAGQVCVSPTRFLIEEPVYDRFLDSYTQAIAAVRVGNGLNPDTQMGPLANPRRVQAMESLLADAVQQGAQIVTGGKRIGNTGNFFEPTILTDVTPEMRVMNEEPFGPLSLLLRVSSVEAAITEANRLPYGLAAYAYTSAAKTAERLATGLEAGMVSINHHGLALPETPFGGIKDSGFGSEGGTEAMDAYLNTKFVTQASL